MIQPDLTLVELAGNEDGRAGIPLALDNRAFTQKNALGQNHLNRYVTDRSGCQTVPNVGSTPPSNLSVLWGFPFCHTWQRIDHHLLTYTTGRTRQKVVIVLKRRKLSRPEGSRDLHRVFGISDGTRSGKDYGTQSYTEFLSNGFTDNEKIEAEEYFTAFLDEQ